MSRLNAIMVAVGMAIGTVGCAQCDTCDNFPAPCNGPNCGGAGTAYGAPSAGPVTYGSQMAPAASAGASDSAAPAMMAPAANPPAESSPPKPNDPSRSGL